MRGKVSVIPANSLLGSKVSWEKVSQKLSAVHSSWLSCCLIYQSCMGHPPLWTLSSWLPCCLIYSVHHMTGSDTGWLSSWLLCCLISQSCMGHSLLRDAQLLAIVLSNLPRAEWDTCGYGPCSSILGYPVV